MRIGKKIFIALLGIGVILTLMVCGIGKFSIIPHTSFVTQSACSHEMCLPIDAGCLVECFSGLHDVSSVAILSVFALAFAIFLISVRFEKAQYFVFAFAPVVTRTQLFFVRRE